MASSQRKMRPKQFDKCSKRSIISTTITWFIEVRQPYGEVSPLTDKYVDLKPENLLYLTKDPRSDLVLADFGIAKMLDSKDSMLNTMAGSFGYAAPEIMLKQGHGKPVDMWSLGVITYTLLCGYSPFRSENVADLIEESKNGRIVFHGSYWKNVSKEAKDFIVSLLQPDPNKRLTSEEALQNVWLTGNTATDFDLLPEFHAIMAKARLKRGINVIKLANRIQALKMQNPDDEDGTLSQPDIPADSAEMAGQKLADTGPFMRGLPTSGDAEGKGLSKLAKGAIFREVVFAKVREEKEKAAREQEKAAREQAAKAAEAKAAETKAKRSSYQPPPK